MNLEDVDRELDSLGPAGTPASLPIERLGDLAAVDAVLASLGEGVAVPVASPGARSSTSTTTAAPAIAPKPPTPPKPSVSAKPPSAPRPPAPKSAMPPPPPKSVMPRVPAPEPTRQVVAPEKPTDSSTRQVVAPSPSSPGSLSADDLFADLADDDVPGAASERPAGATAETAASETTNETSSPLAELFSDLDEEVAEVGNLFEEEPPSEERLSLELGDFDDLVPETGTTSALPSTPPPSTSVAPRAPSVAPSAPSTPPRAPSVAPAAAASPDDFDDFEEPVADSTSLFSAADVAAIRRASSVPAPMAAARPATPSTSSPLDELVLEDDFELLIDDDEADDSTFVGKADDVEASGDEQGDEDPGDDDPSGKKGFFKKLFG